MINSKREDGWVTHTHSWERGSSNLDEMGCGRFRNTFYPTSTPPNDKQQGMADSQVRPSQFYLSRFALNRYKKSSLLFLRWKGKSLKFIHKELEHLDEKYSIGGGVIRTTSDSILYFGLTPHNQRRVEKIAKASSASNKNSMAKFGCTLLQIDYRINTLRTEIIGEKPITKEVFNKDKITIPEINLDSSDSKLDIYEQKWQK